MNALRVIQAGIVPYQEALEWQRKLAEDRIAGACQDVLLLLEHPPVVTLDEILTPRIPSKTSDRQAEQWRGVRISSSVTTGGCSSSSNTSLTGGPQCDPRQLTLHSSASWYGRSPPESRAGVHAVPSSLSSDSPPRGQDAEDDTHQQPHDHAPHSVKLVDRAARNQSGGRRLPPRRDHTALPDILECSYGTIRTFRRCRSPSTGRPPANTTDVVTLSLRAKIFVTSSSTPRRIPRLLRESRAEGERVLDRFVAQMCRTRPMESSAASRSLPTSWDGRESRDRFLDGVFVLARPASS